MKTVVIQVVYLPTTGYGPRVQTHKVAFTGNFNASMLPPKPSVAAVEHAVRVLKDDGRLTYDTVSRDLAPITHAPIPTKSKWGNPNNKFG